MRITILLADDHEIMREGLRALFDRELDLKVIAEASDGQKAVQLALKLLPDIVIMDIVMPRMNGMEATRRIVDSYPDIKVIALSQSTDRKLVREMFIAGASGYVLKSCAYAELVKAIRTVAARKLYVCAPLADVQTGRDASRRQQEPKPAGLLTSREREVLQLLAEGKSTREIAELLTVSIKTIETHRMQIMTKLHTRSIAQLTKIAIREGFTSLD
ncbi:MAG TPA: response regulator transcription factor [Nitrospirota bacterium]|nr:response regulator transcription factor [Nitrospirota bacterium]